MTKRIFRIVMIAVALALGICAAAAACGIYYFAKPQFWWLLGVLAAVVVLAGAASWWFASRMTKDIARSLNTLEPENEIYREFSPVLERLDKHRQRQAERTRQEFTANVSHELKTPLQSIIGSAELLENGLVKSEDTPRFVGHIKTEASRLLSLINDIIRLSQLDEDTESAKEPVDLYEVAEEVMEVLAAPARKRNVSLQYVGGSCIISGIRRYLYEIIYNLCDNAIRYNMDGGKVIIRVQKERRGVILTVEDTGIGIPKEHHDRIFERFYRVDKSHSKETGGTGLGLSIVKHAVAYHGGRIDLDSTPGKGTAIRIHL